MPIVGIAAVIGIRRTQSVDHGTEYRNTCVVELSSSPLDLGRRLISNRAASNAPSVQRPRISASGTGKTGGESIKINE